MFDRKALFLRGAACVLMVSPVAVLAQSKNAATDPGDDFYQYVNADGLEAQASGEDASGSSATPSRYDVVDGWRSELLNDIPELEGFAPASPEQRLHDLYTSMLDEAGMDAAGIAPIAEDLAAIAAINSHEGVARFMAKPQSHAIFDTYAWVDPVDPSQFIYYLDQRGMAEGVYGLPDPSFYNGEHENAVDTLAGYKAYIADMLALAGIDGAERRAADIIALETRLAAATWSPEKQRDRAANDHPVSFEELKAFAPGYAWDAHFDALGVAPTDKMNLATDTAIRDASAIFADTPVETWQSFLAFHWIETNAQMLSQPFRQRRFEFIGREFEGREQPLSARGRARLAIQYNLDRDLGRLFADRHFDSEAKSEMQTMVRYLRAAYRNRIENADWMSEPVRAEALAKLDAMTVNIGYPDVYRDFSPIRIAADDPVGNTRRLKEAAQAQGLSLVDKGWPEGEWPWGTPFYHDAAITAEFSLLTFPAAIILSSFEPGGDPVSNFARIGMIIGHEMGHSFDDQGSKFDSRGVLRDWWDEESREKFTRQVDALANQYSTYEPLPGRYLIGERMVGEALADLLGTEMALDALELYCAAEGVTRCTGTKAERQGRFFLEFAENQLRNESERDLINAIERGYHPPRRFRTNGTVRNMDAWYESFPVEKDDRLYVAPDKRVEPL